MQQDNLFDLDVQVVNVTKEVIGGGTTGGGASFSTEVTSCWCQV